MQKALRKETNSFRVHKLLILVFLVVLTTLSLYIWQISLQNSLENEPVDCGGDFNYKVTCPIGSYCKEGDLGPLAGGYCTPYLNRLQPESP